ncbi:hypothetical protein ACFU8W_24220 [Streptomyces sp. NPDC057565]|uniref:hypothetical protein n=1 Tax=Streptomyces sp. NPDC057565 TaxID=3346169 RepID=UPI0036BBDDC3
MTVQVADAPVFAPSSGHRALVAPMALAMSSVLKGASAGGEDGTSTGFFVNQAHQAKRLAEQGDILAR